MSCNSCAKSFSLLRKEKGCPSCGFSYCSKCLGYKIFVPKLNEEAKVCSKCKNAASISDEKKSVVEPPDAYYKRLGLTDGKQSLNRGMDGKIDKCETNSKDQLIAEKLKNLKEDRNVKPKPATTDEEIKSRLQNIKGEIPSTSDADIEARLAKLRGVPVESLTSKPLVIRPDTKTEQEQADDLLKLYMEATSIDSKYKDEFDELINDMELRMNKLKGTDSAGGPDKGQTPEKQPENVESEDEEETVKKIVEKIKAEASIEDNEISPSTNDELPFCEICNEDATMRCLGCRYLFCKRCFIDHKDDDDDGCNRYKPYQAPKRN